DRELLDARIDAGFAELVRRDAELGGYLETAAAQQSTGTNAALLMAKWRTWRSVAGDDPASEAVHGALIAGIRDLITYVGSRSRLVLDPRAAELPPGRRAAGAGTRPARPGTPARRGHRATVA